MILSHPGQDKVANFIGSQSYANGHVPIIFSYFQWNSRSNLKGPTQTEITHLRSVLGILRSAQRRSIHHLWEHWRLDIIQHTAQAVVHQDKDQHTVPLQAAKGWSTTSLSEPGNISKLTQFLSASHYTTLRRKPQTAETTTTIWQIQTARPVGLIHMD